MCETIGTKNKHTTNEYVYHRQREKEIQINAHKCNSVAKNCSPINYGVQLIEDKHVKYT